MDLLYQKYSSPLDLMYLYINRGRFGEFVNSIIEAENKRIQEEAEKDNDWKLWTMYTQLLVAGHTDGESFLDWKERVCKPTTNTRRTSDSDLDEAGMKSILDKLFTG